MGGIIAYSSAFGVKLQSLQLVLCPGHESVLIFEARVSKQIKIRELSGRYTDIQNGDMDGTNNASESISRNLKKIQVVASKV